MQACPYDALYIDPETHTAAKCNYCAHRIENSLEPSCVVVCPVEAIVCGDLDDSGSKISSLLNREAAVVRKPEKGTSPNLYYIEGDSDMLSPSTVERRDNYIWSEQSGGVGHFAEHDQEGTTGDLLVQMALEAQARTGQSMDEMAIEKVRREIETLENEGTKRTYDVPSKGVLWGWEVPAYIWSKAASTGLIMVMLLWTWFGGNMDWLTQVSGSLTSLLFLGLTGLLLIRDLDRPDRFHYVLLRPNWTSWLVRGGYLITIFGGLVTLLLLNYYFKLSMEFYLSIPIFLGAVGASIYTAFLLAQAKGRDLWQNPMGPLHMVLHSLIAGLAIFAFFEYTVVESLRQWLLYGLSLNVLFIAAETFVPHGTVDAKKAVHLMTTGYYSRIFYMGIIFGNLVPILLLIAPTTSYYINLAGLLGFAGIYLTEFVRIRVAQLIPLS